MDILEIVFAASGLVEAGWHVKTRSNTGATGFRVTDAQVER
jgi:hypothetical protein